MTDRLKTRTRPTSRQHFAQSYGSLLNEGFNRRTLLKGFLATTAVAAVGGGFGVTGAAAQQGPSSLTFKEFDRVRDVNDHWPEGYERQVLLRWGDALFPDSPAFDLATLDGPAAERQFGSRWRAASASARVRSPMPMPSARSISNSIPRSSCSICRCMLALWDISLGALVVNTTAGATWTPIASTASFQSVRRIATTIRTTNSSGFTAETSINTVAASLESGKTYRITWAVDAATTVIDDLIRFRLREDSVSGTVLQLVNIQPPRAGSDFPAIVEAEYTAVATGSKTFAGTCQRVSGTGTIACNANANEPHYLYVDYVRG